MEKTLIKNRTNGELKPGEVTHLTRALAEHLLDADKQPSQTEMSLALLSDVLEYLPSIDSKWTGIIDIDLSSNV